MGLQLGAKSAALLAAPGVLNPTAFYACLNILHFLTRGGGDEPKSRSKLAMLGPCWHYFSLLGVSWACFVALAAFVVTPGRFFGILGRSRLDFGGFRVGLGKVLELLTTYFSMFLLHARLQCQKTPDV